LSVASSAESKASLSFEIRAASGKKLPLRQPFTVIMPWDGGGTTPLPPGVVFPPWDALMQAKAPDKAHAFLAFQEGAAPAFFGKTGS
jgi:hypothetical protein